MSILIPGMEMPTSCLECVFYRRTDPVYDYCCISSAIPKGYVPNDCPLIPVPEHGDLIDKSGVEVLSWTEDPEKDFADGVLFVLDKLDELPVIIPADGEDYEVQADKEGEG